MFNNRDNPTPTAKPTPNGRQSEFDVPYGDYATKAPYTLPADLLAFTPESVNGEIEQVKQAIAKVKAGNRLIPYLSKFTDEWTEFLRQLKLLRTKLARQEITKAQFESSARVLVQGISTSLDSILHREGDQTRRLSERAQRVRNKARSR